MSVVGVTAFSTSLNKEPFLFCLMLVGIDLPIHVSVMNTKFMMEFTNSTALSEDPNMRLAVLKAVNR